MPRKFLILGGTQEARLLAKSLCAEGCDVTTSFAGVTLVPAHTEGKLHVGGFGGVEGLRRFIRDGGFTHVIDATHPFAAQMSRHAFEATEGRLTRFERPAWVPTPDDKWTAVPSIEAAILDIPSGAHCFVTTGRKHLAPLVQRKDITAVVRTIEPPAEKLDQHVRLLLDRPPFTFEAEMRLFTSEKFTHLLTKNAGGNAIIAKLDVCRSLGLPVYMVQRPQKPDCTQYGVLEDVLAVLLS